MTAVKNQGNCGSCYAFAALADVESTFLFRRVSVDLSEQQIVDCTFVFGNYGCNGGWLEYVYNYVKLVGVANSTLYPDRIESLENGTEGECQ